MKLFWRVILPLFLALLLAIASWLELEGLGARARVPSGPVHGDMGLVLAGLSAALFVYLFIVALRNTLKWGKEAEDYQADLKEAEEIEKLRRARAHWRDNER
jgi:hypothetical protein